MKTNIKKTPQEAAASKRGTNEPNQLKDTTEFDENQIPKSIACKMVMMMRGFRIYRKMYGVEDVDIRESAIRMDLPNFLATFPEHKEEPEFYKAGEYGPWDRLSAELYGVTFYAMRRCENVDMP